MSYRQVDKGDRISEYILLEKLGEGGFGAVWKAEHTQIPGKFAAIKIPNNLESMDLLKKEAVFQHQLNHPNIVRTIGLDTAHDPPYFMMEYVEGRNLRRLMNEDGILPPPYAIDVAVQVLEALSFAHGSGIIHKDIKPENILVEKKRVKVTDRGNALLHVVKITDFGFGKLPDNTRDPDLVLSEFARTSGVRLLSGTLFYASPEQMVPGRQMDTRCDLYSVGVVLYEMLTGELPLGMDMPSELNPVVTPELDNICKRALSIDRDRRYATAQQMIADLQRAKENFLLHLISRPDPAPPRRTPVPLPQPVSMMGPGGNGRGKAPARKWTTVFEWSLLLFVIALLGVSIFAFARLHRDGSEGGQAKLEEVQVLQGPVLVSTSDAPSTVIFDGEVLGDSPQEIKDVRHERHEIRLTRKFHDDRVLILNPAVIDGRLWFDIEDMGNGRKRYQRDATEGLALEGLALLRQKGTLIIDVTNVPNVPVYVDGRFCEGTRCELKDLDAGPHTIRLEMIGYEPIEEEILLAKDEKLEREYELLPAGKTVETERDRMLKVKFISDPPGANLYIREEAKGTTPCELELPADEYDVRWELKYYRTKTHRLRIGSGNTSSSVTLERLRAAVRFETDPPGAAVHVDGDRIEVTPLEFEVEAGRHEVKFVLPGHYDKTVAFEVLDDQAKKITETLKAVPPGLLTITCDVPGVAFLIGGKAIGKGGVRGHKLDAGTYSVRVLDVVRDVTVVADRETKLHLTAEDLGMARVPAGEFIFGSSERRPMDLREEKITLPEFYIDLHEVTNADYARFLEYVRKTGDHSRCLKDEPKSDHTPSCWEREKLNRPDQPVVGVSYFDAYAYAAWAGKRLPSEREWEKAARGTRGLKYPWGNEWNPKALNARYPGYGHDRPLAVGAFPEGRSPYGCHDMAGNVWEWTSSIFEDKPALVIRGGDFLSGQDHTTTFHREYALHDRQSFTIGFRCVLDLPKAEKK